MERPRGTEIFASHHQSSPGRPGTQLWKKLFFSCDCLLTIMVRSVNCGLRLFGLWSVSHRLTKTLSSQVNSLSWLEMNCSRSRPSPLRRRSTDFFLRERHLGHVPWSLRLSLICILQSTRALDQGGAEPRQAVSPRPGGQGRYRFAAASA